MKKWIVVCISICFSIILSDCSTYLDKNPDESETQSASAIERTSLESASEIITSTGTVTSDIEPTPSGIESTPTPETVFGEEYEQLFEKIKDESTALYYLDVPDYVSSHYGIRIDRIFGYRQDFGSFYYLFTDSSKNNYRINAVTGQVFHDNAPNYSGNDAHAINPVRVDNTVIVSNYYELIESVSDNTVIYLMPGDYDLTKYPHESSANGTVTKKKKDVTFSGINGLSLIGKTNDGQKVKFISNDPDAAVLYLSECSDIVLENLILSHADIYESCIGVSGWLEKCTCVIINNCDIYGSGKIGIGAELCEDLKVTNSNIFDCSISEINLTYCSKTIFENCVIEDDDKCSLSVHTKSGKDTFTQFIEARTKAIKEGPYGRCVFRCDNNVVDHQVVNILFENDITAAFVMNGFNKIGTRTIKIVGTKGEISGDIKKNEIEIRHFNSNVSKIITPYLQQGGHNGGDIGITREFIKSIREGVAGLTSAKASVQSHLMAFAAEKSRLENRVIDMEEFRKSLI